LPVARAAAARAGVSLEAQQAVAIEEAEALLLLRRRDEAHTACEHLASLQSPPAAEAARCRCDVATTMETRMDEVARICRAAVEAAEAAYGPMHPRTAERLRALAGAETRRGHHEEALALDRRGLAIFEASQGPESQDTANSHCGIAEELVNLSRLPEALAAAERCLAIRLAHDTPKLKIAWAHNKVARVLGMTGDFDRAVREADEGMRLIEAEFGPDDPQLIPALTTQGGIQIQAKRWQAAASSQARCVELAEKLGGIDQIPLANCLSTEARALLELGQPRQALPLAERALAIVEPTDFDARLAGIAHVTAGRALSALGHRPEARVHIEKTIEIYRRLGDQQRTKLAEDLLQTLR
jgi:tetratricopeptide (TPR) repeat protein